MRTKHYGATFNRAMQALRSKLPGAIRVRTVDAKWLQQVYGDKGEKLHAVAVPPRLGVVEILIARRQSECQAVDCLIHEWAHAKDWAENGYTAEHRASWGKWHARAYTAVNG